jgi:hypothetical protein
LRRSSLAAAALAAWVALGPAAARAQTSEGSGEQCWCNPDTNHPGMEVPCDRGCLCYDNCDGSSGQGSGQTVGGQALGKGIAAIGALFIILVAPAHGSIMLSGKPNPETVAMANADFAKVKQAIADNERIGRAIAKANQDLRAGVDEALSAREKALRKLGKRIKAVPKIHLEPRRDCARALTALPYDLFGWPLEGFTDRHDLKASCAPAEPGPDEAMQPEAEGCRAGTVACAGVCCPTSKPVLNQCDGKCYRSKVFVSAPDADGSENGLRCARFKECGTPDPRDTVVEWGQVSRFNCAKGEKGIIPCTKDTECPGDLVCDDSTNCGCCVEKPPEAPVNEDLERLITTGCNAGSCALPPGCVPSGPGQCTFVFDGGWTWATTGLANLLTAGKDPVRELCIKRFFGSVKVDTQACLWVVDIPAGSFEADDPFPKHYKKDETPECGGRTCNDMPALLVAPRAGTKGTARLWNGVDTCAAVPLEQKP